MSEVLPTSPQAPAAEAFAHLNLAQLREAALAFKPRARAAVLGGSRLYGLSSARSDVDVWVFHALPARAFLGLSPPALVHSRRSDLDGRPLDLRAVDIKALAASWLEGSFYEIEHLFSPLVLFGEEWLAPLRAEARRHATRNIRDAVSKRAGLELRFGELEPSRAANARLHALRVLAAGALYLETAGEVISDILRLNERVIGSERLPETVKFARSGGLALNGSEARLEELDEDILRVRARLDRAFQSAPAPRDDSEARLDYFLKRLRVELDEPATAD
jgi:hypothetical protein